MYYDDSKRRLNLLSGLVFGAALGAGLALLLLPEERLRSGGRIVVRAARGLGRDIYLTQPDLAVDDVDEDDEAGREDPGGEDDVDGEDEGGPHDGGDDEAAAARPSPARRRAARLARRKFEL